MASAVVGWLGKTLVGRLIVSYALNAVTNKLFGKKVSNNSSPTYSIGTLQTQTNSDSVMPIIYGKVKCAGNNLWQSGEGQTVQRLVGFGLGHNKGVSDVRLDDKPINAATLFTISYTGSELYGRCRYTGKVFYLYTLSGSNSLDCTSKTSLELITWINSFSGWHAASESAFDISLMKDINTKNIVFGYLGVWYGTDCTNTTLAVTSDALPSCSYTAYMGDGEQQIDSRVTGATQEAKAKIVGGMKYDAYLALTITASDKLSGDPNLTAIWEGRIVRIYDTPTTYHEAWSDNVWCVLDFMTSIDGCNIPIANIDIQSFIDAAAYAQPADNSRRWSVNLILDNKKSRQDWLNDMLLCFRAWRTYQNGKHGILLDKPEPVSQIFIVKKTESIQLDWQELKEDVERIILKYRDPDYEWQNVGAPATIKGPFRNQVPLTKTVEVNGITNFKQASQHAWFYVNQAQTCGEYITYTCNKRALNRTIGDVIGIFDPITQVTEPGLTYKRYRILGMTEPQGISIQLYCREYNEALYLDAQGSVALVVNITKLPNPTQAPPDVSNIQLGQVYYRQKDGTIVSYMTGTCDFPDSSLFGSAIVEYSDDNGVTWTYGGTYSTNVFIIPNVKTGATYLIKIKSSSKTSLGIFSSGVISDPITITGKDAPPSDIPSIAAVIDQTDNTKLTLSWPAVTDIDLRGYQLREGNNILTPTPISDTRYIYTVTETRNFTFSVYAVDNSGNLSKTPATVTIALDPRPAQVAGFSVAPQDTNRSQLVMKWQANTEKDIAEYIIKVGDDWDTATIITHLKALTYTYEPTAEGSMKFMIKAVNNGGLESATPAEQILQVTLRPDAPRNLDYKQEPLNRSKLLITWDASPGHDISGYELRYGHDWDTGTYIDFTQATSYEWEIPASGSYNIMVRAKTVAGYYSNVSNVSVSTFIEAYDVTGFTGSQSISDRSIVHLTWSNPLSLDIQYFEIRRGASWDSGVVVGQRVQATFFDDKIPDEGQHTWWIKAVTVAGKYSLYPASFGAEWDLNPSPVTNIKLVQDENDRSLINITWTGITEIDLMYYEIRYGWTWETATVLIQTSNTNYQFRPNDTSGNVKIMIKAFNTAKYSSDEASTSLYATLEPQDVQNFIVQQNGEYVELYWDRAVDHDVVGFEIREGATFDFGELIATNITGNSYNYKVDFDGIYHYWIKAINRSNKYSVKAVDQRLTVVDLPPKNIIQSFDEIEMRSGTHDHTEFGASEINFQTIGGQWPDYPEIKFEDSGGTQVLRLLKQAGGTYPISGVYSCRSLT
jgi:hypothetical protein